jgi:hypothetical protein
MPTYDLKNTKTGEVEEYILTISKKEEMVESGEYEQVHLGTADLVTHTGGILSTTSGDWRNFLTRMKKGSGRNDTINTY